MSTEFTRLSGKGQTVVPSGMRKRMKLGEGTRFVIVGLSDTIILRKIEFSQERITIEL